VYTLIAQAVSLLLSYYRNTGLILQCFLFLYTY